MKTSKNNNNTIDALESDYLFISQSQIPNSGNGLYTAINIYKEETVSIFKGEILNYEQANKRAEKGNDKYFIDLNNGSIMDSMSVMCFAKYANDAKGAVNTGFKNNTKIVIDDNGNVCLQAVRKIYANEEVFCGYGKEYWKKHG